MALLPDNMIDTFIDSARGKSLIQQLITTPPQYFCGIPVKKLPKSFKLPIKKEQFRIPKSKKKRIRKKFSTNPENFREVKRKAAFIKNGTIHMEQTMFKIIKENC